MTKQICFYIPMLLEQNIAFLCFFTQFLLKVEYLSNVFFSNFVFYKDTHIKNSTQNTTKKIKTEPRRIKYNVLLI